MPDVRRHTFSENEMEQREWEDRLDEVQKHAEQSGNQVPSDDLFRGAANGAPLSKPEKEALQQHWDASRRQADANREPF